MSAFRPFQTFANVCFRPFADVRGKTYCGGPTTIEESWPKTNLSTIGDSSSSLYLTHTFVLPIYFRLLDKIAPTPSLLIVVGALVSATIIGHLTYIFVEHPIMMMFCARRHASMA